MILIRRKTWMSEAVSLGSPSSACYSAVDKMDKYVSVKEIEEAALSILPKSTRDYYKSGATDEQTLKDNQECFRR